MTSDLVLLCDLFAACQDSVAVYERDARCVYVNAITEQIFGKRSEELVGNVLWELFPDAVGNAFYASFTRVAETGRPERLENYFPFDRWFDNHLYPARDWVVVVATDITASKRDQIRARQRLESLLMEAPACIALLEGPDHVYTLSNPPNDALLGKGALVGRRARDAIPEAVEQGFIALLDQVYQSGQPYKATEAELLRHEPDGSARRLVLDFLYQPTRDPEGRIDGVAVFGWDVTRAVDARREGQVLAERLKLALEASDLGDWSWDAGSDVVTFSARAAEIFGIPSGPHMTWTAMRELLHEDDRERARIAVEQAVDNRSSYRIEYRVRRPSDAREVWVAAYGRATYADSGAPTGMIGIVQDVSVRRQLLERESAARHEAEAANRLKDEFLATVSHELRTPLTAILGWVHLLRTGRVASEKHARALETIERNARTQAQLIEDLLDVSRILSGKLKIDVDTVMLGSVVEQAIETVRPAAEAKDLCLQATLDSSAMVMGDATRLRQVVWNLLANAVKFTPRGGRIEVLVTRRDSSVEISVSDTGIGIEPAFLPYVFQQFRQADASSRRETGGLGLGLSIVRHVVEMHGGTVTAESEGEGKGTTFFVRLPLSLSRRRSVNVAAPRQSRAVVEMADDASLEGLRVLVVDDEADARELLRTMLASWRARVCVAASTKEALAALAVEPVDVLISDIGMSKSDGIDLIRRVRALSPEAGGRTPAIALTAYARTEDRTRVLRAGFQTHLAKPVEPMELFAVLSALTGRT